MPGDGGSRPAPTVRFDEGVGRWVLVATVGASGMALLDSTVVNVALPSIGADLGADVAGLQWILNGYLLPLAALILLGGALGDRYGRRRVFTVGVVWFVSASLLCALAPATPYLVAARAMQGVGGALLTPASLAIIQSSFVREDRAKAIGAWSALGGVAAAVGPLLGGYLVAAVSWRAIFLLNVPIGVVVVLTARRFVPESRDPAARRRLDLAGALTGAIGLAGLTFALIEAPRRGATSAVVLGAAAVGITALVAFVVGQRRSDHPMLPAGIFAAAQFRSANLVTFVVYAGLGGVFFLLVVHLQNSLGYSPIGAGAAMLPVTGLMLILSAQAGALAQRLGPRLPLTIGPLTIAGGMVLMTRIEPGAPYLTTVLPGVVVFGLGLACTVAPVTATVLAAAEDRHAGVASGVNNAVARVAGLLTVAALPVAAGITGDAYADPQLLTDGFRTAMLITAALAAAGAILAWFTIDNDVLAAEGEEEGGEPLPRRHCAVDGPPQRPLPRPQ